LSDCNDDGFLATKRIDDAVRETTEKELSEGAPRRRTDSRALTQHLDRTIHIVEERGPQSRHPRLVERGGFVQLFPRQGKIAMGDHFRRLRASAITSSPGIASTSPRRYWAYRRSASSIQTFSISGSCPGSKSSISTRTSAAFSCAESALMRLV